MKDHLKITKTTELNEVDKRQVFDLWNSEYPEKLTYNNILEFDNYLNNLSNLNHYLLTNKEHLIFG